MQKRTSCILLPAAFLGLLLIPSLAAAPVAGLSAGALTQTLKRLADSVLDKNATVDSVSALVGPLKQDWGDQQELTPRDPAFSAAAVMSSARRTAPLLPVRLRRPDDLELTLAHGSVVTPHTLQAVFGPWRHVPPPPEGNPYQIVCYYPNARARRSVAVFAALTGPPERSSTRVVSLTLRRDDWDQVEEIR